tara:strand:- start:762 stop:1148 length:387 start_codon:yes stop_codon:yes gene_type:complete
MKVLLLSFILVSINIISFGQCSFEKNDIDKFTKEKVIITKHEKILTEFTRGARVRFALEELGTYLILDYFETFYTDFNDFSVNEGQEIILLLEDETTITLKAAFTAKGKDQRVIGLPPSYTWNLSPIY